MCRDRQACWGGIIFGAIVTGIIMFGLAALVIWWGDAPILTEKNPNGTIDNWWPGNGAYK